MTHFPLLARTAAALLLSVSLAGLTPALADEAMHHDMADMSHDSPMPAHMDAMSYQTRGKVVALNAEQGLITLAHEAVPALNWPAMTMPFRLADKALLDGLAVGQAVEFGFVPEPGQSPKILSLQAVN